MNPISQKSYEKVFSLASGDIPRKPPFFYLLKALKILVILNKMAEYYEVEI